MRSLVLLCASADVWGIFDESQLPYTGPLFCFLCKIGPLVLTFFVCVRFPLECSITFNWMLLTWIGMFLYLGAPSFICEHPQQLNIFIRCIVCYKSFFFGSYYLNVKSQITSSTRVLDFFGLMKRDLERLHILSPLDHIAPKCTWSSSSLHEFWKTSLWSVCPIIIKKVVKFESQSLFCMCHIPGCSFRVMVEPVDECVGAGEVIGAGPHISAFYSVQFPHSISEKCFFEIWNKTNGV